MKLDNLLGTLAIVGLLAGVLASVEAAKVHDAEAANVEEPIAR